MKTTVYHTAFYQPEEARTPEQCANPAPLPTREFSQPKDATVNDPEGLCEFYFAATNAPPEMHSTATKIALDHAKNTGRVYSQSVGDLVLIEAKNCKALYITAGVGFKLIAAAKDARRALNDLLAVWVLGGCERSFFADFARLHEAPEIDPIAATLEAFAPKASLDRGAA
jgi:hypothetical protein